MRGISVRHLVILGAATMLLAASGAGCGPQAGTLLYFTGLAHPDKTSAAFDLARKPLLILVDDDWDLVHPPTARDALVDALATELRAHKLVEQVTTNEELAKIRQTEPNFEKRGAREIGQLAKADLVLWLKVVRFTLPDNIDAAMVPCYFGVSVKVLDAKASKREDVCLWPKEREGKLIEARVSPHDLQACKSVREAHKIMAGTLASEVAKLFYEHEEEEQSK